MTSRLLTGIVFGIGLAAAPAFAQDVGTADEAKALVARAVEHIAKVGAPAAYKDFTDTKGAFVDRDLYVFCLTMAGDTVAHGGNPALMGKNLKAVKDSDGKAFVEEFISVANGSGAGWVDYKWPNPTTKKIEAKSSYVVKAGDGFCGVGIYKK